MYLRILLPLILVVAASAQSPPSRIIDMHLHVYADAQWKSGIPPNPVSGNPAPASSEEHLQQCLRLLNRYNIVAAVITGPLEAVEKWRKASGVRLLGSPMFGRAGFDFFDQALPPLNVLRTMYQDGRLKAMAEVTAQYEGLSASDITLDPYFALAEELDIPVGIHTGASFPGTPYHGKPKFRLAMGNPLLLEDLLVRRPKLRVYIMHGGAPWTREAIALLKMYPQVYTDVAVIDWIGGHQNLAKFNQVLREFIDAGLGKRIMFGTDQMLWPDAIPMAINAIESADFLSEEQKRDIFCRNAARFLRLAPETCD